MTDYGTDSDTIEPLDLTREFSLRRWARQNYVSRDLRDGTWHPIVLEEMAHKDTELAETGQQPNRAWNVVPLVPFPASEILPHGLTASEVTSADETPSDIAASMGEEFTLAFPQPSKAPVPQPHFQWNSTPVEDPAEYQPVARDYNLHFDAE